MGRSFLAKVSSRKFWAGVTGVIISLLVLLHADANTITSVTALITAVGTIVIYIAAEAHIDANKNSSPATSIEVSSPSTGANVTASVTPIPPTEK